MRVLRWLDDIFDRFAPVWAGALLWTGIALLLVSAGFAEHSWDFARHHVRSMATITENVSTFAPAGGVRYFPRFRFRTPGGELVQVVSTRGSEDVVFDPGEVVPVLYRANDPQHALIATAWRAYFAAIVTGVLGVVLFDVGYVMRILVRRRLRSMELLQCSSEKR